MRMFYKFSKGQIALSLVLTIGAIMVIVGTTITFLVFSFINSGLGFRAANEAEAIASGGVEDAMLQLVRNKDFSDTLGYCVPLECGAKSAFITVTPDSPKSGEATIISNARVFSRERTIEAVVEIATSTGEARLISWKLQ